MLKATSKDTETQKIMSEKILKKRRKYLKDLAPVKSASHLSYVILGLLDLPTDENRRDQK